MLIRRTLVTIAALVALGGSLLSVSASTSTSPDQAAFEARQNAFVGAMSSRDAAEVAAFFSDDAVLHIANQPPIHGRAAIHQFYSQVFRFLAASQSVVETVRMSSSADLAYTTASVTNAFEREGQRIEYAGKSLLVWEKRDQVWYVAAYTVSNNRGEPAAR